MEKWQKIFLFAGLPLLVFYIFLIIIFFAFISGLLLSVLIIGGLCLRKRRIWAGLTKMSVALILFFTILIPNPLIWPEQIARHLDTSILVTPNDLVVQNLNDSTEVWDYLLSLNATYTTSYFYNNLSPNEQLLLLTNFCLYKVDWILISAQYGVIDYVATPQEALSSGMGDCQARTVVMTSFFIFMGYDAYSCEAPFHWFTCVYLGANKTDPHYYYIQDYTPDDVEIMFNHEEVIYTKNIVERLGHIIFNDKFAEKLQEMLESTTTLILLPAIFVVLGFLIPLALESTDWKSKKHYLKNAILCSTILIVGFLVAFGISLIVPQLILFSIIVGIVLATQSVHSNLGVRLFSKKE